jgi:hypothetical protein
MAKSKVSGNHYDAAQYGVESAFRVISEYRLKGAVDVEVVEFLNDAMADYNHMYDERFTDTAWDVFRASARSVFKELETRGWK